MNKFKTSFLLLCFFMFLQVFAKDRVNKNAIIDASRGVLSRLLGTKAQGISIETLPVKGNDTYEVVAQNGNLTIRGNSSVAICHGFYTYYKEICHGIVRWSGNNIPDLAKWPDFKSGIKTSPYKYRNYLNVVTFGYTTAYWDWQRWQKEIDWMALHGYNFPLAVVGAESIGARVWKKLGLNEVDLKDFFTGPAYLPWHRMGNLNKWDGPLEDSWHKDQLQMQHKIIDRMRSLGMSPIAPAFAGFVPRQFKENHPEMDIKTLKWGGFSASYNAYVLPQRTEWFSRIGKMFVEEWEKEFGKNKFYLSDSFNEMDVPVPDGHPEKKFELLADYGESIYKSITAANPEAVWVTQGWTFGYKHKFWDTASVKALLSKVPDDKMIILDLANEFPKYVWHIDPIWKTQKGFYGKNWIFSYVANFGGKIPLLGDMHMYAKDATEALHSPYGHNMIGFGVAPEGIENNEAVFELLSDMGWSSEPIDIKAWVRGYCLASYGAYPKEMKKSWELMLASNYSFFEDYPRYLWQLVIPDKRRVGKVCDDPKFMESVKLFLKAAPDLRSNGLYKNDAIEMAMLYLGVKANNNYERALNASELKETNKRDAYLDSTVTLLNDVDRLLASHPLYSLNRWTGFARAHGHTTEMKNKYERDAKKLITVWGGTVADYAAKLWSGLIRDYYIPRLKNHILSPGFNQKEWEENWVNTPGVSPIETFANPLDKAIELVNNK